MREKPKTHSLTKLIDTEGRIRTEQSDLQEVCRTYYQQLYAPPPPAESQAIEQVLNTIVPRVTARMQQQLNCPLTVEELRDAARDLAKDRAPGPDGVSIMFFTHHWGLIGQDYMKMVNQALQAKQLPKQMTRGVITLIHKGGQKEDLGNWRPITLLNAAYKILAKALQND